MNVIKQPIYAANDVARVGLFQEMLLKLNFFFDKCCALMHEKGFFISLEGGEGVGKTTQIKLLSEALEKRGHDVVTTREPGGSAKAEAIRNLLSDPSMAGDWLPLSELLLIYAGRADHIDHVIKPALDSGKIVITDRYIDSTQVYQGVLQSVPQDFLDVLRNHIIGDLMPDLTFILDLTAEDSLARVQSRGSQDHYDSQSADFYEQVRQGFLSIAKQDTGRCHVIDANQPIDDIHQKMADITLSYLG